MNIAVARTDNRSRRGEIARVSLLLLGITLASVAWHAARPYLVLSLAKSSVGCALRVELVSEGVARLYPEFPVGSAYTGAGINFRGGPSGWTLAWRTWADPGAIREGLQDGEVARWVFLDERFNYLGSIALEESLFVSSCADWDHDGHVEVLLEYGPWLLASINSVPRELAVVRLTGQTNEVVGLVAIDYVHRQQQRNSFIDSAWRSDDRNRPADLALVTVPCSRLPDGTIRFAPAQVFATLGWTAPGGVLRPSLLPDDGTVLVWTPPEGRPYSLSPDTPADLLFRELLPLPPDFGTPTSGPASALSQPTSAASQPTSTTSQPALAPTSGPD